MYQVIIAKSADRDMTEAAVYISAKLHNPTAADRLMDEAHKAIYSLDEMPHRHRLVDDEHLASLGMRSFVVRNHLVFYIVNEELNRVEIERFMYSGRNWAAILKGEEPEDDNFYPTL